MQQTFVGNALQGQLQGRHIDLPGELRRLLDDGRRVRAGQGRQRLIQQRSRCQAEQVFDVGADLLDVQVRLGQGQQQAVGLNSARIANRLVGAIGQQGFKGLRI